MRRDNRFLVTLEYSDAQRATAQGKLNLEFTIKILRNVWKYEGINNRFKTECNKEQRKRKSKSKNRIRRNTIYTSQTNISKQCSIICKE